MLEKLQSIHYKLRYRDESFDYRDTDTSWGVHGIHPYPAMMIYPIARRLILEFTKEEDYVLDPFMGSGTVIVESLLYNRYAYGIDINPLALLLAQVKTTHIRTKLLLKTFQDLLYISSKNSPSIPKFFNINYWFKETVIKNLSLLLSRIEAIEDPKIKNFFKVVFSETVRCSSNTKNGEFKLLRIKDLDNHNPSVFAIFKRIGFRNIKKLSETYRDIPKTWGKMFETDTRVPIKEIEPESINLILTSPPYGDSKTTVAYGQFSRLTLQWLGYDKVNIDRESLGGICSPSLDNDLPSPTLQNILQRIALKDTKRAREVLSFYIDLNKCFLNLSPLIKYKGYFCIVIGNRRVKRVTIPTDVIVTELCQEMGLTHLKTIIRSIPTKRMPRINSPTNIEGITETTMNNEYIIILRKDKRHEI